MPNLLTIKRLNAVHLVDKGAAKNPRVIVIKRRGETAREEETPMSLEKKVSAAIAAFAKAMEDEDKTPSEKAIKDIAKCLQDEPDKLTGKMIAYAKEGMDPTALLEAALQDLPEDKRAAIMAAVAALYQAAPPPPAAPSAPAPEEKVAPEGEEEPPAPEEEDKPAMKSKKSLENALSKLGPEERKLVEAEIKARDAEVEKRKDLQKEVEELQDVVAKGQAESEFKEQLEIAKSFEFVPGDFKKRAQKLLALKKSDEKLYAEEVAQLKSTNELLKSNKLTKARGTSRGDEDVGDEPAAEQLERMANDMLEKAIEKGDKKMTFERAYRRVIATKKGKELLRQSQQELQ